MLIEEKKYMLIGNFGKAGKSPEKKVSIICVLTLLSPQFFLC